MTNRMVPTSAITTAPPELLGSGTRDGTRFLRDDGVWAAPAGAAIDRAAEGAATVPILGTIGPTDLNLAATVTGGGTDGPTNPAYVNDGNGATESVSGSLSSFAGVHTTDWTCDLGSTQSVGGMTIVQGASETYPALSTDTTSDSRNGIGRVFWSDDGSSWTEFTAYVVETISGATHTYDFAPMTHRYWRVEVYRRFTIGSFGIARRIATWSIWDTTGGGYDPAPELVDGDDTTYRVIGDTEACRVDLGTAYRILRSRLLIGCQTAGAKSYELYGATIDDYSDEVLLGTYSFTAAGSYATNDVEITFNVGAYRYYRLVGPSEWRRVYAIELWDAEAGGGITEAEARTFADEQITAASIDDLADVDITSDPIAVGETLVWDGTNLVPGTASGEDTVLVGVAAAGASVTIDCSVARTYDVTLTADCTVSLTGAVDGEAHFVTVAFRQNGTGGWTVSHPGSVVWAGGTAPTIDPDPAAVTFVTYASFDGGTTWYGFASGGGGSAVGALDDLSDVAITTPAEGQAIRYRSGVWVNEVVTSPRYEVVMTGSGAGLEPVTTDDETDWIYAEV